MIFFPGDISNEAIEYSNLLDDEKEKLRLIVEHNRSFFTEQLTGLPFLLLSSKYDISEINNDITIFEKILNDANRLIIPGLSEPPVRTLRATIPENGSHIFR